jgi:hypothetical protein
VLEEGGEEPHQHRGDEDDSENTPSQSSNARWREDFPQHAGQGIRRELTMFESLSIAQATGGESIWGAFSDEGDWDFARWILKSGTTHASTNELLELKKVSQKNHRRALDLFKRHRSETPCAPRSIIADLSSKRLTLFRQGRNGLVNSLRWRETLSTKVG